MSEKYRVVAPCHVFNSFVCCYTELATGISAVFENSRIGRTHAQLRAAALGKPAGLSRAMPKGAHLPSQFAAVDGDDVTRDERRLVGREKHDCLGDLFRRPCAFEWHAAIRPAFRSALPVNRFSISV